MEMKEQLINEVVTKMRKSLTNEQLLMLHTTLSTCVNDIDVVPRANSLQTESIGNDYYINMFLSVKSINGLERSSLLQYKYTLQKYVDTTGYDVTRVSTNNIRVYLASLQKTNQNSSVNNHRKVLSSFYTFLFDEGYMSYNPMKIVYKVKEEKKVKKFWDDYDIECLRDACENKRELALIDFLLSTGIRIHEVPQIKVSDINWLNNTVIIHGKGNKDRLIPFSVRAKKHLQDYLQERTQNSEYLFCRLRKPYDAEPTKDMINNIFIGIRERAGLPDITIHGIRRWLASHMADCGADPLAIQDMLGHSSFDTTEKHYLRKNIDNLILNHNKYGV